MFLPGQESQQQKEVKRQAFKRIEQWCEAQLPETMRSDCMVSVQEFMCGDPNCAPVDTAVTLNFKSSKQGMFGIPMEAHMVTEEEIETLFPTPEVIEKWHRGEDAEWPPDEEIPALRFVEGQYVQCRVGPTDWAPGQIIQIWYREPNWPPGSFAPYKIKLDDGRSIFAPADMDQVVKLDTNKAQPSAP